MIWSRSAKRFKGSLRAAPAPMPSAPDSPRAPWRWERLLVDAAVIGGRDRWRRRLDGLVREIALRRSELAEDDARTAGLARVAKTSSISGASRFR